MTLIEAVFFSSISCGFFWLPMNVALPIYSGYNRRGTYHVEDSENFLLTFEGRTNLVASLLSNRTLQTFKR